MRNSLIIFLIVLLLGLVFFISIEDFAQAEDYRDLTKLQYASLGETPAEAFAYYNNIDVINPSSLGLVNTLPYSYATDYYRNSLYLSTMKQEGWDIELVEMSHSYEHLILKKQDISFSVYINDDCLKIYCPNLGKEEWECHIKM